MSLFLYNLSDIIKNSISSKYKGLIPVNISIAHKNSNIFISSYNLATINNNSCLLKYSNNIENINNGIESENICISLLQKLGKSFQVIQTFIIDINYIDSNLEIKNNKDLRLLFFSSTPILYSQDNKVYLYLIFNFNNLNHIFEGELDFINNVLKIRNQKLYKFKYFSSNYFIPFQNNNNIELITNIFPFTRLNKEGSLSENQCNFLDDIISSYKYNVFHTKDKITDSNLISLSSNTPVIDFSYNDEKCKLGIIQLHIDRSSFYFNIVDNKKVLRNDKLVSNLIKSLSYTICDKSLSNIICEEYELFVDKKISIDNHLNLLMFYILDKNMNITRLSSAFMLSYPFVETSNNKCSSLDFNKETNDIILCYEESKNLYKILEINADDVRKMMIFDAESFSADDLNFSILKPKSC
jgi:hypothetical protein